MVGALVVMAAAALQQPSCDVLRTMSSPQMMITAVELVPEGASTPGRGGRGAPGEPLPAHCRVAAALTPSADSHIEMELWLPLEGWNGKFLAVGNGGWAGSISTAAMAGGLRRGYATASNDTGHQGGTASFALGHQEKLVDFGYRAMHEMAVQSKVLIQAFYRRGPDLSYYQGCSTGGRQGLMEAQRFPQDFDAIVAGAPVYNQIHLNVSQVALQLGMLANPASLVPPEKRTLLANAVVAACDARDGVTDGINYHEAVQDTLGGDQGDWMCLFLMPGVGHCGGGVGPDQADFLGAMEQWREQGVAPDRIIATRPAGRGRPATPMSRPLCPFPQVARFTGSGSTSEAASFACVAPSP